MNENKWKLIEDLAKTKGQKVERIAKGMGLPSGERVPLALIVEEGSGLCIIS